MKIFNQLSIHPSLTNQSDTLAFVNLSKMLELEKIIDEKFKKHCPIRFWLYKKTKLKIFFTTAGFHIAVYPRTDKHNIGRAYYQLRLRKLLIKEIII